MATIVTGQHAAKFSCDWHKGCHAETEEFFGYGDVPNIIDEKARKLGWYVSFSDDKSYCPYHSPYNINRGSQ